MYVLMKQRITFKLKQWRAMMNQKQVAMLATYLQAFLLYSDVLIVFG